MDLSKSGNIREHYKRIGNALLTLEPYEGIYSYLTHKSSESLAARVSFIPDEVLESYLEDLLDFQIDDIRLYIQTKDYTKRYNLIAILGLFLAMAFGLILAYSGNSFLIAMSGMLLIVIPSGCIWHLAPKIAPNRRLFFARLISQELDRRNGKDIDSMGSTIVSFLKGTGRSPMPEMS